MSFKDVNVNVGGPKKGAPYTYKEVILKPNKSFAEQVTDTDRIYVIKWDFDLGGGNVTIPENCVLKFEGGSLSNGSLVGNNTSINAELAKIFNTNVIIEGTWNVAEAYPEWFGAVADASACCRDAIQKSLYFKNVKFQAGTYKINANSEKVAINVDSECSLRGSFRKTRIEVYNLSTVVEPYDAEDKTKILRSVAFLCDGVGIEFRDMTIVGPSVSDSSFIESNLVGIGIYHQNSEYAHNSSKTGRFLLLNYVNVYYFHDGIYAHAYHQSYTDVEIRYCYNGFTLLTSVGITTTCLRQCSVNNILNVGYYLENLTYSSLISCAADVCGCAYYLNNCNSASLRNCGSEWCTKALYLKNSRSIGVDGFAIALNNMQISEEDYISMVTIDACNDVLINNLYKGNSEYLIGTISDVRKFIYFKAKSAYRATPDVIISCSLDYTASTDINNAVTFDPSITDNKKTAIVFTTPRNRIGNVSYIPNLTNVPYQEFYDTVNNCPCYWNGEKWLTFDGFTPGLKRIGSTQQRPIPSVETTYSVEIDSSNPEEIGPTGYKETYYLSNAITLAAYNSVVLLNDDVVLLDSDKRILNDRYYMNDNNKTVYIASRVVGTYNNAYKIKSLGVNNNDIGLCYYDTTLRQPIYVNGINRDSTLWIIADGNYADIPKSGNAVEGINVAKIKLGYMYIQTSEDIGKGRPLFFDGTNWIDANGFIARDKTSNYWNRNRGTTSKRPVNLTTADKGFVYFDTDLENGNGKPIWWNGTAWVDATGATV